MELVIATRIGWNTPLILISNSFDRLTNSSSMVASAFPSLRPERSIPLPFSKAFRVFSSLLPRESNQKIIGLAEEHRVDILTYEGGEIITNNEECPYAIAESNINHLPLRQVEDMKSYVDFRVPKFLMLDDGDYLVTVEPKVKAAMGRDFSVYRSEPYFLEIMPKGIDKAQSLARLLEVLGLEREQMIACGDGYNDLTMIKYAGLGVAMENAVLPLRQAADYITASNNHDGVGVVVEKFMLY